MNLSITKSSIIEKISNRREAVRITKINTLIFTLNKTTTQEKMRLKSIGPFEKFMSKKVTSRIYIIAPKTSHHNSIKNKIKSLIKKQASLINHTIREMKSPKHSTTNEKSACLTSSTKTNKMNELSYLQIRVNLNNQVRNNHSHLSKSKL